MINVLDKIATASPYLSWIKDRCIYLTIHGSRAYNTHTETSDTDIKGVCVPPKEYYFGFMKHFEQAELKDPDTSIYEIKKFFNLLSENNPNLIEMLFTDPSDHIFVSPLGEEILSNREEFLSKRARWSFAGYGISQIKRIKLHRKYLLNPPKEYPTRAALGLPEQTLIPQDQLAAVSAEVQKDLDKYQFDFIDDLTETEKIGIRSIMSNMLAELKITTEEQWLSSARKVGLSDNFIQIMQKEREYTAKKREWDQYQFWKTNRNPERAAMEAKFGYDGKHAGHVVRLFRMCREMLETGKVIVKRPDREELLAIKGGAWSYDKLIDFAEQEEKKIAELYITSDALPKSPNREKLDSLCQSLIEKSFK